MNVSPHPLRHSGPRAGVSAESRPGSATFNAAEIPDQARNDTVFGGLGLATTPTCKTHLALAVIYQQNCLFALVRAEILLWLCVLPLNYL